MSTGPLTGILDDGINAPDFVANWTVPPAPDWTRVWRIVGVDSALWVRGDGEWLADPNDPSSADNFYDIDGNADLFVIATEEGAVWTAPRDGTYTRNLIHNDRLHGVRWIPPAGRWVVAGDNGDVLYAADPTGAWTAGACDAGDIFGVGRDFDRGIVLGAGRDSAGNGGVWKTTDGASWDRIVDLGRADILMRVDYNPRTDRWIAVGGSGTAVVMSGADVKAGAPVPFDDVATGSAGRFESLAVGPGDRWAAGTWDTDEILTSDDGGATWTVRDPGTTEALRGADADPDGFVFAADAGTVVTSPDGATWTVEPTPSANSARMARYI